MNPAEKQSAQAPRSVWGERYGRELDTEEQRQLRESLLGFIDLLQKWAEESGGREVQDAKGSEAPEAES